MKEGDKEDYLLLQELEHKYVSLTYERIIDELNRQGEITLPGYKITRYLSTTFKRPQVLKIQALI